MSRYGIKEVFATLQGEGLRAGAKSVFVRFTGCNLWNGNPLHRDRGTGACAKWCDTDFINGRVLSLESLLEAMDAAWPLAHPSDVRWCVLTGGEPALQIDKALIDALHDANWLIAVETNGTVENLNLRHVDHICLSPKYGTAWDSLGVRPHELKVVLPGAAPGQMGWSAAELKDMERFAFGAGDLPVVALFVQPQDPIIDPSVKDLTFLRHSADDNETHTEQLGIIFNAHLARCVKHVVANPLWRLSLQTHKYINLP